MLGTSIIFAYLAKFEAHHMRAGLKHAPRRRARAARRTGSGKAGPILHHLVGKFLRGRSEVGSINFRRVGEMRKEVWKFCGMHGSHLESWIGSNGRRVGVRKLLF